MKDVWRSVLITSGAQFVILVIIIIIIGTITKHLLLADNLDI